MNDKADLRRKLSAALDGYTPNPIPYPALIRRGLASRRQRRVSLTAGLAGIAAVAIITPFLLGSSGGRVAPAQRDGYHVTVRRPGPHSPHGLIAYGTLDGVRWRASAYIASGGTGPAVCFWPESRGGGIMCPSLSAYSLTRNAPPVTFTFGSQSEPVGQDMPASFQVGIVRSDVSYLRVRLSDGQILTLWPVNVLGRGYGRLVAIKLPAASAVLRVTAFSTRAELGYAIPFTRVHAIQLVRWLRPAQTAGPSQVSYQVGSGQANGITWSARLYAGPWGTCWQIGVSGLANCSAVPPSRLGIAAVVSLIEVIGVQYGSLFCFGRVSHNVSKVSGDWRSDNPGPAGPGRRHPVLRRPGLHDAPGRAVLLSLTGGAVGVLVGAAATTVYARGHGEAVVIPPQAWAGSLAAAVIIGTLSGLLPAIRAARLSPTQALLTV